MSMNEHSSNDITTLDIIERLFHPNCLCAIFSITLYLRWKVLGSFNESASRNTVLILSEKSFGSMFSRLSGEYLERLDVKAQAREVT